LNEQETFWAGKFGDEYTARNADRKWIDANIDLFSDALAKAKDVATVLELGCNKGLNLAALEYLDPSMTMTGIDVNGNALRDMVLMFDDLKLERPYMHRSTIVEYNPIATYDLVFTKGVLIHINPDQLESVYDKMYALSNKYILVAEYYNPSPVAIEYRGQYGKLFKRDFAGELIKRHGLKLVDYGFKYHLGKFPQDDLCWFLMEKA
jgi:pseudaminic acid biosynthesis-associated methylase